MSSSAMSLKCKIKNYAKKNHIAAQVVLQNYMFECFLARLSASEYCDKFVIKGGMLIAAIVGLDTRSTMDLDTTLRNLPLTESKISSVLETLFAIKMDDGVSFALKLITPIRENDMYGGYCVKLEAVYDTIITPLSIDISTGDIITPGAVVYEFSGIFDENQRISLWGYNIETVMAEKIETILSRNVFNTRTRDFYDVYILGTTQEVNYEIFKNALKATAEHRGSTEKIINIDSIIEQISTSSDLKRMWNKYQKKFAYAENISYESIMETLKRIVIPLTFK